MGYPGDDQVSRPDLLRVEHRLAFDIQGQGEPALQHSIGSKAGEQLLQGKDLLRKSFQSLRWHLDEAVLEHAEAVIGFGKLSCGVKAFQNALVAEEVVIEPAAAIRHGGNKPGFEVINNLLSIPELARRFAPKSAAGG
jgi:hypothetical protein